MASTCILTDQSALFPSALSSGNGCIRTFPSTCANGKMHAPPAEEFHHLFSELEHSFDAILVLNTSAKILSNPDIAQQAAKTYGGTKISVLDSQQIGPGVGLLAQLGARVIMNGATLSDVEEQIRSAIPHIYTLICPEFDHFGGPEDQGQTSIFSIEEGALVTYKQVRTRRHLLEAMQEFIQEFEHPQQIAYFRARVPSLRARPLRETVGSLFPGAPFTEMEINPALASLFGPQTIGLTMMELPK